MAIEEVGVRLLAENAAKFERDTKTARAALLGFVDTTVKGSKDIDSSSAKSERAIVGFVDGAERAYGRLDAVSEIAIGALRRVGEIAVNALLEAGRATTDFLKDSVSVAGNFEATLNRFASVTGDSLTSAGMDVGDFSDLFLQMGADTQFSAGQAAEAAVELAKGGLKPAEIAAGGLAAALTLAAAGELDLATAAEITAKQLGVWRSEGVTAADVADLMAQAANASTVGVAELALGLAQAGGVAKLTGLSFEETNQTIALLAPGFGSASDAGTSFKTFLAGLIPTTEKATFAMMDLGLYSADTGSVFFDAQGEFIGMRNAIGLLQAATAGLSEEERLLALETMFGQDAIRAAALLAEQGVPAYDAMGVAMAGAGTAAEQAGERNKGFAFAMETLKGSVETLQIVLGTAFLPMLTDLIDNHITPAINGFMEFAKSVLESEDPLGTFADKINETLPGFRELVDIARSEDPASGFIGKIDESIPGFENFIGVLGRTAGQVQELGQTFLVDAAPSFETAKAILETGLIVLEAIFNSVFKTIKGTIDDFTKDMRTGTFTWTDILDTFKTTWEVLQPVIIFVLQVLGAAILGFIGGIVGLFSGVTNAAETFFASIQTIVTGIALFFKGFSDVLGGIWDLIVGIFTLNGEAIEAALERMRDGAFEIVLGLMIAIWGLISGILGTVAKFVEGFVLGIIEFFARLYYDLVGGSIVVDLVNDILGWFGTLLEDGKQLFTDLVNGIKAVFDMDWAAIGQGIVNGIKDGITGAVAGLVSAAQGAAQSAYTAVTDYLGMESPSKLFMDVGMGAMEGLAIGVDEGSMMPIQALEGAVERLAADLPQLLAAPVAGLAPPAAANNNTSITNVYQGNSYDLNVRTSETAGTVGNTIRSLQQLSTVGRG